MSQSSPKPPSQLVRLLRPLWLAALLTLGFMAQPASALSFAIPPFLPQEELEKSFAPLVEQISQMTGLPITLKTFPSYLAFWQETRSGSPFDIALDAAPTTDFRDQRQHWRVIAKMSGTVTQSLVTGPDNAVLDPSELINKKVAVQPSPSVSALTLYQLFPNPVQQPAVVYVESNRQAAEQVLHGSVDAAIIPTPIAVGYPALNTVTTTNPLPFLAISISPKVTDAQAQAIRDALLNLNKTSQGQALLKASQLRPFEPATNAEYTGQEKLLEGTFGY